MTFNELGMHWPENAGAALTVFGFCTVLAVTAFEDWRKMKIPDACPKAVLVLAVFSVFTMPQISVTARLAGALCVSVPMFLITLISTGAFGGGDIKLMAACGLFLGQKLTLVSAAIAFIAGGIYGIVLLIRHKANRKTHFAFGPFLCAGMIIALFFGQGIMA